MGINEAQQRHFDEYQHDPGHGPLGRCQDCFLVARVNAGDDSKIVEVAFEGCEDCDEEHKPGRCPKNAERASAALEALSEFARKHGEFPRYMAKLDAEMIQQNAADLICNLAHLLDVHDIAMMDVLSSSKSNYEAETQNTGVQVFEAV